MPNPGADHVEGATEPWIQDLVVALLFALQRDRPTVLECGGFQGHTSAVLATAIQQLGGGTLHIAEYDPQAPERAAQIIERLGPLPVPDVVWRVHAQDALTVIRHLADESVDLAYLDDDHTPEHVHAEIEAIWPKMRTGGLICGHDVFGSCALHTVFERFYGYALDFPRLGPAGGLGIIQVR